MAAAAKAIHLEAVQAPLAVCCNSVLSAASLAMQGHYDVQLPYGSNKPISLFILSILETGGRKSAADEQALKGVVSYEAMLRASFDAKDADYKNRLDAWKGERLKITRKRDYDLAKRKFELDALGREPTPPPYPIIRYTEPSIEGLIQTLRFGHPSAGLFTTEGGQFISGHNMSDTAVKRRSTGTLNRLWDGETADRIRVAEKFILVGRRVCAHLLAQPDVAYAFISDRDLEDNGFLSRWLISAPDSLVGTRFNRTVSIKGASNIDAFKIAVLSHLQRELPYAEGSCFELKPKVLEFSAEAAAAWWEFRDKNEIDSRPDGRLADIIGFANKLPEHAARIAAVIAAFEGQECEWIDPVSDDAFAPIPKAKPPPPKLQIDKGDIERGIQLANYYAAEALRLKRAASVSLDLLNAQKLLDWMHEHWKDKHVTVALLVAHGPSALRDTAVIKQLVHILERNKWLIPMEEGQVVHGKKRKESWEINKAKQEKESSK
jgi:hypothetical protein